MPSDMDLCLRASFPHSSDFFDASFIDRGSDLAHSVVWNDGEVFYLVGSSGGNSFDRQCPFPFPNQSYCELDAGPLGSFTDQYDGMIARFDMRTIDVGVVETRPPSSDLVVFPSPALDYIRLRGPDWINAGCLASIADASGRIVLASPLGPSQDLDISGLAAGSYTLQLRHPVLQQHGTTRFIK